MINDFVGHDAGDKAIKGVSQYLKENLPSSTVYRTGGDEFMVICDGKYDTTIIDNIKNIVLPFCQGHKLHAGNLNFLFYQSCRAVSVINAVKFYQDDPFMKTRFFHCIFHTVYIGVLHFQKSFGEIRIGVNTNITPHTVRGNYMSYCEKFRISHGIIDGT